LADEPLHQGSNRLHSKATRKNSIAGLGCRPGHPAEATISRSHPVKP